MGKKGKLQKYQSSSKTADNFDDTEKEGWSDKWIALTIALALVISGVYRSHISGMFESDRHFSHLSSLERELGFRTEMGLYYSYFKTMIEADSLPSGIEQLVRNNITEFPSTINTLKRFNLYPEVVLGVAYRFYRDFSSLVGHKTTKCWTVNRGEGQSPVQSCEGLGEPAYFYVEQVYILNGLMMGLFFLIGTLLSDSMAGGLFTVVCYFFNQGECSRAQWTPPLRESFGYPIFILEMFIVTIVIKQHRSSMRDSLAIAGAQVAFMLSWQFAQFTLLTQLLAVLGTYVLGYISAKTFKTILLGLTIGMLTGFVLLFGNEMVITSIFACAIAAAWVLLSLEKVFAKMPHWIIRLASQGVVFLTATLVFKVSIGKVIQLEDDAHIGEIFASKFTDFQNFHTMLYTCAKEFDYLEWETIVKLTKTILLPSTVVALGLAVFHLLKAELKGFSQEGSKKDIEDENSQQKPNAEIVYHVFQLLAFTAMAILIMRLKLFWTPQLCIFVSLLASRKFLPWITKDKQRAMLVALVACMSVVGWGNLTHQWKHSGEFSNPEQEQMVEWIKDNTPQDAVFAGSMPIMATVMLTTRRPIVNHPHYEDAGLRARTKLVYSMYSRKSMEEVKQKLQSLGVQYVILEMSWCQRRSRPGCGMAEIWDLEDVENRGVEHPVCWRMHNNPKPHFKRIFRNRTYDILKIN